MDDLQKFHELFLQTAHEHIEAINTLIQEKQQNPTSELDLPLLHRHAHSLKGEAYAIGYRTFGNYITVFEKYLKALIETNQAIPSDKYPYLLTIISELRYSLDYIRNNKHEPEHLNEKTEEINNNLALQ